MKITINPLFIGKYWLVQLYMFCLVRCSWEKKVKMWLNSRNCHNIQITLKGQHTICPKCNATATVPHNTRDISWVPGQACFCAVWFLIQKQGRLWYRVQILTSPGRFHCGLGVEGTQTSPAPRACSPHLLWLAALFTPGPVGNVSMRRKAIPRCTGLIGTHTYVHIDTDTHSSLFHLQPGVFESLTGAAFLLNTLSRANSLSNLSLDFYTHTPTAKQATRPNWHFQYFKTSILGKNLTCFISAAV